MSGKADDKGAVQQQSVPCSNTLKAGVFMGFGVLMLVIGAILTPSMAEISAGFREMMTMNIHLGTAMFYRLGEARLGVPFINSGILAIIVMASYLLTKTDIKGGAIAAAFMVMGFAFCGKNFLNVWPTFCGVLVFAAVKKKKISGMMGLAWFATSLSPLVNTVAMYTVPDGKNAISETAQALTFGRILAAVAVGLIAGFLVAAFAEFLPDKHDGLTLYNAGFAAGLAGMLIFSVMKAAGIGHSGPNHVYIETKDAVLGGALAVMMLYLLIAGLVLRSRDQGALKDLVLAPKKGCFVDQFGFGTALVNMALCGFLCLAYPFLTTTGHANAMLYACLMTVVGFASNGITLKTMVPVMLGVFSQSVVLGGIKGSLAGESFLQAGLEYAGTKNMVVAACFGCGMAPVVVEHGYLIGFLAAMIHGILSSNTDLLHGWMNMYNNGFCLGLVVTFFVPMVLQCFKKGETPA